MFVYVCRSASSCNCQRQNYEKVALSIVHAAMHYMCTVHVGDKKMGMYSSALLNVLLRGLVTKKKMLVTKRWKCIPPPQSCNPLWGERHLHEQGLASSYIWGCTIAASQLSVLFLENNLANRRPPNISQPLWGVQKDCDMMVWVYSQVRSELTAGRWIWLGMQKKLHRAKTRREIMSQVLCLLDEGVVSSQNWALWPTGGLTDRQYPKCAHSIPMGQA